MIYGKRKTTTMLNTVVVQLFFCYGSSTQHFIAVIKHGGLSGCGCPLGFIERDFDGFPAVNGMDRSPLLRLLIAKANFAADVTFRRLAGDPVELLHPNKKKYTSSGPPSVTELSEALIRQTYCGFPKVMPRCFL